MGMLLSKFLEQQPIDLRVAAHLVNMLADLMKAMPLVKVLSVHVMFIDVEPDISFAFLFGNI
jgi:hypothetical protein